TTALPTAETVPVTSRLLQNGARIDFMAAYGSIFATISLMRMIGLTTMPVIPDQRTNGMTSASRSAARLSFPPTTKTRTNHFSSIRKIGDASAIYSLSISRCRQQASVGVILPTFVQVQNVQLTQPLETHSQVTLCQSIRTRRRC